MAADVLRWSGGALLVCWLGMACGTDEPLAAAAFDGGVVGVPSTGGSASHAADGSAGATSGGTAGSSGGAAGATSGGTAGSSGGAAGALASAGASGGGGTAGTSSGLDGGQDASDAAASDAMASDSPSSDGTVVAAVVPDFGLLDVNATSSRFGASVSPRDYLGQVSAWYFGHAT